MQIAANASAAAPQPTAASLPVVTQKTLGETDFLTLLAAQLSAQDPMAPTDNTQFISQMANFSSLQQMTALNTNFTGYASSQLAQSAPQYLGKQVTVTDASGNAVSGVATGFHVQSGSVLLTINGQDYPIASVTGVTLPSA